MKIQKVQVLIITKTKVLNNIWPGGTAMNKICMIIKITDAI